MAHRSSTAGSCVAFACRTRASLPSVADETRDGDSLHSRPRPEDSSHSSGALTRHRARAKVDPCLCADPRQCCSTSVGPSHDAEIDRSRAAAPTAPAEAEIADQQRWLACRTS